MWLRIKCIYRLIVWQWRCLMPGELTVTSTVNCLSNFQKIGPYLKHFLIGKQCCRVLHRTFKCSKVIFTLAFFPSFGLRVWYDCWSVNIVFKPLRCQELWSLFLLKTLVWSLLQPHHNTVHIKCENTVKNACLFSACMIKNLPIDRLLVAGIPAQWHAMHLQSLLWHLIVGTIGK